MGSMVKSIDKEWRNSILSAIRAIFFAMLFTIPALLGAAVSLHDTYYSPKNKERPARKSTRYIILHTTEGASKGAGTKLQKNGEAHYMVDTSGRIYRIIDRKRVAFHCGRSMWNGLSSLDNYSIGIEVVGYHNKDLTASQYSSLNELIAELQKTYKLTDDKVLTHSMVAYGAPNQWHKRSHRGRKRCAMRMALPSVRKKLGLTSKPSYDPDVKAKRLVVADKELHQLLYSVEKKSTKPKTATATKSNTQKTKETASPSGKNVIGPKLSAWDIAKSAYNRETTHYIFPDGTIKTGAEITDWKKMVRGTVVLLNQKPISSKKVEDINTPSTDTVVVASSGETTPNASMPSQPNEPLDEESAAIIYAQKEEKQGNIIGPGRSAWDIARDAYNSENTLYIFPNGTTKKGTEIKNWRQMPSGTKVIAHEDDQNPVEEVNSLASIGFTADDIEKAASSALAVIAGAEWNHERTIYVLPDGTYYKGNELDGEKLAKLSPDTKVFSGYRVGGPVSANNPAFNICGPSWCDEGTHFLFPNGTIVTGDKVDPKKIPAKAMILYKD